jgi:serine/threonine-protein kinase
VDLSCVRNRGDEIAGALSDLLASQQIATSDRIRYLGVAHGWAGLVYALLRWARATQAAPSQLLTTKLSEIAELAIEHEGGLCWTMESESASFMPGWCHGTAGYTMLFALAYEVTGEPDLIEFVEGAADSAWNIATAHTSLCCGDGGNGYAFLAAHRLTGDRKWLTRARSAARRAVGDDSKEFPDSLYKGELGVLLLSDELDQSAAAAMPLFEPVRFAK